jgi:hypothetical protein
MVRGGQRLPDDGCEWRLLFWCSSQVITLLALWKRPLVWLAGPQRMAVAVLRWAREHLLTVAIATLMIGIAQLVVPFLVARLQRVWNRRDAIEEERQDRDRRVMLQRVRNRWIAGVLEKSLTDEVRIALGLARRWDVLQGNMSIRLSGGQSEPLPAATSVTEIFEKIGGGLLILGVPGSGKTMALLELTRDLLNAAEVGERRPIPVVFNLSSWAVQRPPFGEWLVDELHERYDVSPSIAKRWVAGGEILPLLDGLDEIASIRRDECVEAINSFQKEKGPVRFAVCSRSGEYAALCPAAGRGSTRAAGPNPKASLHLPADGRSRAGRRAGRAYGGRESVGLLSIPADTQYRRADLPGPVGGRVASGRHPRAAAGVAVHRLYPANVRASRPSRPLCPGPDVALACLARRVDARA